MAHYNTLRTVEDLRGFLGGVRRCEVHLEGTKLAEYMEPLDKELAMDRPGTVPIDSEPMYQAKWKLNRTCFLQAEGYKIFSQTSWPER